MVVSYQQVLLAWRTMAGLILAIIIFIPIRRYTVAGNLPIELEPYRIVIMVVLACWFCALLVDPQVRWRRTGLEWPIGALVGAMLLSMAANIDRVNAAGQTVVKNFTFFASYLLIVYFIASVIRSRRDLDRMVRLLVGGGTDRRDRVARGVEDDHELLQLVRARAAVPALRRRGRSPSRAAAASAPADRAQHPIALSAALVLLVPLAFYLFKRDRRRLWLGCCGLLDARRAVHRLAHRHDDADRPAGGASCASSRARACGWRRCCCRC